MDDRDVARPIAPQYIEPIREWLAGSALAWGEVLADLTSVERATIVRTMRAYETALDRRMHA
ncbi:hypothetical protein ABZ897_02005 [Nonomuraea sp. NPDC046802]|uniref:hypothetical protein n=1 Tax=Nonomuraea sp. NPDC046802 TaxID=3154919 RepID=UPI00340292B8